MYEKPNCLEKAIIMLERNLLKAFRVNFLSLEEINSMLERLAAKASEFNPDCVVAILRGGYYAGRNMADFLKTDYQELRISKDTKTILGVPLNERLIINKIGVVKNSYYRKVEGEFEDKGYERVLVVDEDCTSGKTIRLAKQTISNGFISPQIKTAVIRTNFGDFDPDYFVFRAIPSNGFMKSKNRFPWACQSPHYQTYLKWYKNSI